MTDFTGLDICSNFMINTIRSKKIAKGVFQHGDSHEREIVGEPG